MESQPLRLLVGLGNPGREYAETRHNVGFIVLDALARKLAVSGARKKFGSELLPAISSGFIFQKPMEFMNVSGGPVVAAAHFYRIPPALTLVISDDLDLPFGRMRMRANGGHGGHNGLRSIIDNIGPEFPRLRIGIGRGRAGDVIDRVLGDFTTDEKQELASMTDAAIEAILLWRDKGIDAAMRFANVVGAPPPPPQKPKKPKPEHPPKNDAHEIGPDPVES